MSETPLCDILTNTKTIGNFFYSHIYVTKHQTNFKKNCYMHLCHNPHLHLHIVLFSQMKKIQVRILFALTNMLLHIRKMHHHKEEIPCQIHFTTQRSEYLKNNNGKEKFHYTPIIHVQ